MAKKIPPPPKKSTTSTGADFTSGFKTVAFPDDLYNPMQLETSRFRDFLSITINQRYSTKESIPAGQAKITTDYTRLTGGTKTSASKLFKYGGSAKFAELRNTIAALGSSSTGDTSEQTVSGAIIAPIKDMLSGALNNLTPAIFSKINTLVLLPMPVNIRTNYNMQYSPVESNAVIQSVLDVLTSEKTGEAAKSAGAVVAREFIKSKLTAITGSDVKGAIDKYTGAVANPRTEQLFKSVNNRVFQFQYVLAPRTPKESESIHDILKTLKIHMHPEMDSSGTYWLVPNEFDIDFYSIMMGKDSKNSDRLQISHNPSVPLITTCVLESLDVDYTPNGFYSSMTDGKIPWISFSMTFRELQPLHREAIKNGY